MDQWDLAARLFSLVSAPSTFLCVLLAAAALTRLFVRRLGRRAEQVGLAAALALAVAALTPLGNWIMVPLENRFPPRPPAAEAAAKAPIAGIILLGGGVDAVRTAHGDEPDFKQASDRVRAAAIWAQAYPLAPVVVSGGKVNDRADAPTEADLMADALIDYGVAPARIRREATSRSTFENAVLFNQNTDAAPWVLVTSAHHMPRAVGAMRAAGVPVLPSPCDWRVNRAKSWSSFSAADNLDMFDKATREWLGLLAYALTGKSSALFPAPSPP
jgi:uncharacterized SAM-binding protein YcdF (DUF218 family)